MARKKRKDKRKEWLILTPLFLLLVLLVFFNVNVWQRRAETREHFLRVERELERMVQEEEFLDEKSEKEVDMEKELERIAREQLLLRKEGEEVVLISRREDEDEEEDEESEKEEKYEGGFLERVKEILPWW